MIIDISVAVIALAFVVLVIYLITIIKALRVTLSQVNQTLVEARVQLGELSSQTQKVVENTNQMSSDLKPIFNAINQAGQILEHQATALKRDFIDTVDEDIEGEEKKRGLPEKGLTATAAILELAGIGINLWQKIKKRR